MVAWLIPALKAVLPQIGIILAAAVPVFTKKSADALANQTLMQEQISELQSAASQNAAHIKELAAQLQSTVAVLEQAAAIAESRGRRSLMLCVVAILFSTGSLAVTAYFFFAQP